LIAKVSYAFVAKKNYNADPHRTVIMTEHSRQTHREFWENCTKVSRRPHASCCSDHSSPGATADEHYLQLQRLANKWISCNTSAARLKSTKTGSEELRRILKCGRQVLRS